MKKSNNRYIKLNRRIAGSIWGLAIGDALGAPLEFQENFEPIKSYIYGGIHLPNSFLCTSNLIGLFQSHLDSEQMFACENVNNSVDMMQFKNQPRFMPTADIIGSIKENPVMLAVIKEIESIFENGHYTSQFDFKGCVSSMLYKHMQNDSISVIDGRYIGVKDDKNKPITIDDLMQEEHSVIYPAFLLEHPLRKN